VPVLAPAPVPLLEPLAVLVLVRFSRCYSAAPIANCRRAGMPRVPVRHPQEQQLHFRSSALFLNCFRFLFVQLLMLLLYMSLHTYLYMYMCMSLWLTDAANTEGKDPPIRIRLPNEECINAFHEHKHTHTHTLSLYLYLFILITCLTVRHLCSVQEYTNGRRSPLQNLSEVHLSSSSSPSDTHTLSLSYVCVL
jgi:hypothetical protein